MFARRRGRARARPGFFDTSRLSIAQTIDAVVDAARRWTDADFPPRVRTTRALVRRTGYTEPVIDYALDALFGAFDRTALRATIESELGSVDALDGFATRGERPAIAYRGVDRVAIVSSDTTVGVAVPALVFALCAGASAIVKDRDDRLVAAFTETLVEERPELAARVEVGTWDGSDAAASQSRLGSADTVVAFGNDETLRLVRAHLKAGALFVPFGHRTSLGYVEREALANDASARAAADRIARDALLYDGDGCLSLHAAFVERGGAVEPHAFARLVADAFDRTAHEFPAGYDHDAAFATYRHAASFRAAQGDGAAFAGALAPHLVAFDQPRDEPPPLVRRTIALYAADGPAEAADFVRRHALPLEAVAFAAEALRPDLEAFALASGASRVATLGTLQRPPIAGEHGGHGRILPFVRAIYRG